MAGSKCFYLFYISSYSSDENELKKCLQNIKQNNLFPGRVILEEFNFDDLLKAECAELDKRKKDNKWVKKWKLEEKFDELIEEISKEGKADEDEYFCFLTEEEAMNKLFITKPQLEEIIKLGRKEHDKIRVLVKKDGERRVCYTHTRKLPLELL